MKISLEVLKHVTLSKKKPWNSIQFISEEKEDLLLLGKKNVNILNLTSGKIKKKISKLHNYLKNSAFITNTKDGNYLVILLQTGTIIIWNYDIDFVWTIDEIPFLFSPTKKLKNFIFASNNIDCILVILHTHEIFFWQRNSDDFNNKNALLQGKWTKIDILPDIPFQITKEVTADAIFIDNSIWGKNVICTFVFLCKNEISTLTLQIFWKLNENIKIKWFNTLTDFKNFNLNLVPSVDKRAFIVRFANNEPLLAIAVDQKQGLNSFLIFTVPLLGSNKYINLPGDDAANNRLIVDIAWIANNTLLFCLHNNGDFCVMTRLGHAIHTGVQGCNFDLPFGFYTNLYSINSDFHISKLEENSDSTSTESNNLKNRYSIATHPKVPVIFYSDGFSIIYLLIPPAIQNEIALIENLLISNNHIQARLINPKDKTKFKLINTHSEEESSIQSENIQEIEFGSVRRISHLSDVTVAIVDLLASFALLASTPIPWDEKMEILSLDTVGKLSTILEDLFIYSIDVDRNWKFPVGIIDSIVLKCLNLLRFDVHHNLMATSLKFLMTLIDLLLKNVKRIKRKEIISYLNCVYEIITNSEQLFEDVYSWTSEPSRNSMFSYHFSQLICTNSEDNREFKFCFQHRLKMKWKQLYKIILQCFLKISNKPVIDDEDYKNCTELLCKLQLKLQISGYKFKKCKKIQVPKGVYNFLNGNYNLAIVTWTLQMDKLLSKRNLHDKAAQNLEQILHFILYSLLITNDLITIFKLIQKLLKFLQLEYSFNHICAINSFLLTFAHLLATYLTNCNPKIPKCSIFILKSAENIDIFQLISREKIQSAVTTYNLSDFWSPDTACALYIFVGAYAEAAIFADAMGDSKTTFLMAVIHSKIEVLGKTYFEKCFRFGNKTLVDIPSDLTDCKLMTLMLKQIIEAETTFVDVALSKAVTNALQDNITASVLCDINVIPTLLTNFNNQLKLLLQQLHLAVPEEFYLPSPPIFCPQDEMILVTKDAKNETEIRNELSNLIHSFVNLLTATKTLLPAAYKYAKDLQCSALLHSFIEYQYADIPDQMENDETLNDIQVIFQHICSVIWLLHSRDKLEIEWRNFWRTANERKLSQHKCDGHCLAALTWAKCIEPFSKMMQWNLEFNHVVLSLAREATASTKLVDIFVDLIPVVDKLPQECEYKVKLLLKEWETNKLGKNSAKTLLEYYQQKCQMKINITEQETEPYENNEDFLNLMCLFYDVAIHKRMEETTNVGYNIFPLVTSNWEKIKEKEMAKKNNISGIDQKEDFHQLPENRDLVKLDIKCPTGRKRFFQSLSLLDLTQTQVKLITKRSKSLDNIKAKDKKISSTHHKHILSNRIPIKSILNELQSMSKQRKHEESSQLVYLNKLVSWLDKWKRRNHTIMGCDKEVKPQVHIKTSVEQILSSISRIEMYSRKRINEVKSMTITARKPQNKIYSINRSSTKKMNEQNSNTFTEPNLSNNHINPESASLDLPNSAKFEELHVHPTGLDSSKQLPTVSEQYFANHLTKSDQVKPMSEKVINQTFDKIPNNGSSEHTSSDLTSLKKDDDTLNEMSFPDSPIPELPRPIVQFEELNPPLFPTTILQEPISTPFSTVNFHKPTPPPLPRPCIPKFLRLVAEKENFQTKNIIDPRLRGGGCFAPMQIPLLRASTTQNNNAVPPPCLSHWGLPLLRLPQKYLTNQTQQQVPSCHVCEDDNSSNKNMYIQNMIRNYWINMKQNRCQQMVDYSLNRNLICQQATTEEPVAPNIEQMQLLNAKYSSSEDNIQMKYEIPVLTDNTSDSNVCDEDLYRQQLQSDSSCQQMIRHVCSPQRTYRKSRSHPKMLSKATSPIRTPPKSPIRSPPKSPIRSPPKSPIRSPPKSPIRSPPKSPIRSPTKSCVKMITKTTSPMKIPSDLPVEMATRTTSPISMSLWSPGKIVSNTTSPIKTSVPCSPVKMATKTTSLSSLLKMVTKTTSPPFLNMVNKTTSPPSVLKMVSKTTSPIRTSPCKSPKKTSPVREEATSPISVCSPRKTPSPLSTPKGILSPSFSTAYSRKVCGPPTKVSSVIRSKSLSSSKIRTRSPPPIKCISRSPSPPKYVSRKCVSSRSPSPVKSRSRSPSPTRRRHLVHSCMSPLRQPNYENIASKTSYIPCPELPIKDERDFNSCLEWQPSIGSFNKFEDNGFKKTSEAKADPKNTDTEIDNDICLPLSPASPGKQTSFSENMKNSLLDVVNEFAETHHHVISQLEEVHKLMKEIHKQDNSSRNERNDISVQVEDSMSPSETNHHVRNQLQEVHDFMREMYQDRKGKEVTKVQDSSSSEQGHSSQPQKSRRSTKEECKQDQKGKQKSSTERETSGADDGYLISPTRMVDKPDVDLFSNIHLSKNSDSGIDSETVKNSILDFQIPDFEEKTSKIDNTIKDDEVPIMTPKSTNKEDEDLEIIEVLQTPQDKARDSLNHKLEIIKEQTDLMESISNELQMDFEHSKQLLNSVNKLSENTMFETKPLINIIAKPRLVYKPLPLFNLNPSPDAHLISNKKWILKTDKQAITSPIQSTESKNISQKTGPLSFTTCERATSAATSKNQPSVPSPIQSQKECQQNIHKKLRMQKACELMKELLVCDVNVASCRTEHMTATERDKPKEINEILTKMEETLKNDLSKLGFSAGTFLQTNSWTTNSNDSCQLNITKKEELKKINTKPVICYGNKMTTTKSDQSETNCRRDKSKINSHLNNYSKQKRYNTRSFIKEIPKSPISEEVDITEDDDNFELDASQDDHYRRDMIKINNDYTGIKSLKYDQRRNDASKQVIYYDKNSSKQVCQNNLSKQDEHCSVAIKNIEPKIGQYRKDVPKANGQLRERCSKKDKLNVKRKFSGGKSAVTFNRSFIHSEKSRNKIEWRYKPKPVCIRLNRTEYLRRKFVDEKKKMMLLNALTSTVASHGKSSSGTEGSKFDKKNTQPSYAPNQNEYENFSMSSASSPSSWNVPSNVMKIIYEDKDEMEDYYL